MKPKVYAIDIEANGLLYPWEDEVADTIHCICGVDENGKEYIFDSVSDLCNIIDPDCYLVLHYGIRYDLPLLEKLGSATYTINLDPKTRDAYPDTFCGLPCRYIDTFILSKMIDPDQEQHGLEWWGEELGIAKPVVTDWQALEKDVYIHRCLEDCKITMALYKRFLETEKGWDWRESYEREKAFAHIIHEQCEQGVSFDSGRALSALTKVEGLMGELESRILPLLPPKTIPKSRLHYPPKIRFKGTGEPGELAKRYFGSHLLCTDRWYVDYPSGSRVALADAREPLVTTEPMGLGDLEAIKQWLIDVHGWKPTYWNFKKVKQGRKMVLYKDKRGVPTRTTPRFHDEAKNLCPNLARLGETTQVVKDIILWLSYRSRRNVIQSSKGTGWLHHKRLGIDGRLPADMDTVGAITGRVTHKVVANVPRVTSLFGEEMRGLFVASDGMVLVGWDASQLEANMEAHEAFPFDGGQYADEVAAGKIHETNMLLFSCSRDTAKSAKYALLYGAGAAKLATVLGVSVEDARLLHAAYWDRYPGLKRLQASLLQEWEKNGGYIRGLDGRKLKVRSPHAILNTRLQSDGAIVMKEAAILWHRAVKFKGLDTHQVIHYHDEAQAECPLDITEQVGKLGCWSIKRAGETLGIRVPLGAEYKIGADWALTH